nr:reverse transcriptase domain-containing protein [Tanacetum cinerariifolium]
AFRTTYKTPTGCTSYKLVYEKACHLPVELEYKAYWALKHANFDLETAGDHRKVQINELNELRDQAYENSLIYKQKTKRIHDSKIKNRVFALVTESSFLTPVQRFSSANSKAAGLARSLFLKFILTAPSSCHNPTGLTSKSMVIVLSTILERTLMQKDFDLQVFISSALIGNHPRWENDPGKLGAAPDLLIGKGCFVVETPLFEGMIVASQAGEGVAEVNVDNVFAAGVADEGATSVANDDVPAAHSFFIRNLFPPLDNHELTIQRRSRSDPTLLNNSEMAAEGPGDLLVLDLRTMKELCQPSLNGRGDPIASIAIQATKFGLENDMIQQSIKVNGVTDDALRLYLFPHSLTHHAPAWFDRLLRNSINTFEQMAKMFLGKYFPPSMVTKLRNEITNFCQRPNESLFEAWESYKLSIDRCPNHTMFPVTQIYTFYNGLTLRHRDTINAAAGGTFMKTPQRSESSSSITSSFDTEIEALKAEMAEINKNLMRVLQVNQQVKAVTPKCETCDGPHSFFDCPATVGNTQNVYATGAYQGNSYQPQANRNLLSYRSVNYLGPPGFNQNQNRTNQNHNFQNQNMNQGNDHPQGINQGRN